MKKETLKNSKIKAPLETKKDNTELQKAVLPTKTALREIRLREIALQRWETDGGFVKEKNFKSTI